MLLSDERLRARRHPARTCLAANEMTTLRSEADAGPDDRSEKWEAQRGPNPTFESGKLRKLGGARAYVISAADASKMPPQAGSMAADAQHRPCPASCSMRSATAWLPLWEYANAFTTPLLFPRLDAEKGEQRLYHCSRLARRECACPHLDYRLESWVGSIESGLSGPGPDPQDLLSG